MIKLKHTRYYTEENNMHLDTIDILCNRMKESFHFFKTLSDDEMEAFLSFCENKQVDAGETLNLSTV